MKVCFLNKIGGWNISGGIDVKAWNLQSKLTLMHNKYNRGGLFEWTVSADEKNSTRNILDLQQGGFVMPRDYYLNKTEDDEIIVAYLDYMVKVGVLLGGEENATRQQMLEVFRLEKEISKVSHFKYFVNLSFHVSIRYLYHLINFEMIKKCITK